MLFAFSRSADEERNRIQKEKEFKELKEKSTGKKLKEDLNESADQEEIEMRNTTEEKVQVKQETNAKENKATKTRKKKSDVGKIKDPLDAILEKKPDLFDAYDGI